LRTWPSSTRASTRSIHASADFRAATRVGAAPIRERSASDAELERIVFSELRKLFRLVLRDERICKLEEIAVHDRRYLVERQVDPVVRYAALREVVGADTLRAVTGADEGLARRGALALLLAHLLVLDARGEYRHRACLVLVLRAVVLALD